VGVTAEWKAWCRIRRRSKLRLPSCGEAVANICSAKRKQVTSSPSLTVEQLDTGRSRLGGTAGSQVQNAIRAEGMHGCSQIAGWTRGPTVTRRGMA